MFSLLADRLRKRLRLPEPLGTNAAPSTCAQLDTRSVSRELVVLEAHRSLTPNSYKSSLTQNSWGELMRC